MIVLVTRLWKHSRKLDLLTQICILIWSKSKHQGRCVWHDEGVGHLRNAKHGECTIWSVLKVLQHHDCRHTERDFSNFPLSSCILVMRRTMFVIQCEGGLTENKYGDHLFYLFFSDIWTSIAFSLSADHKVPLKYCSQHNFLMFRNSTTKYVTCCLCEECDQRILLLLFFSQCLIMSGC